jgi:hypothetical protein
MVAIEGPRGQTPAGFAILDGWTLILPAVDPRYVHSLFDFRAGDGVKGRRED